MANKELIGDQLRMMDRLLKDEQDAIRTYKEAMNVMPPNTRRVLYEILRDELNHKEKLRRIQDHNSDMVKSIVIVPNKKK